MGSHNGTSTVTVFRIFNEENSKDWLEELMPIYEYECEQCSLRFELKRHFNENTEVNCPRCQGKVHQIFSPVPIIFKGPGFYATDSRENKMFPKPGDKKKEADKLAVPEKKEDKKEGKELAKKDK